MHRHYAYWLLCFLLVGWSTAANALEKGCHEEAGLRSLVGNTPTEVTFVNNSSGPIHTYWLDYQGRRIFYAEVPARHSYVQQTYLTHPWVVATPSGDCLRIFMPEGRAIVAEVGGTGGGPSVAQEPFILMHELHIHEGGGFLNKTLKEMGTQEFQTILSTACNLTGYPCDNFARGARAAATVLSQEFTAAGGNHYITGRVVIHDDGSEEWRGIFDTFQGYDVCIAGLDYGNMSISGESTFNTSIFRPGRDGPPGLGFYAVVPKHRQSAQWIDAVFAIKYVPAGTTAQYGCPANGTITWRCKGQDCPDLTRMDAVLTGRY